MMNLGAFPGSTFTNGFAINSSGVIAGETYIVATANYQAIIYTGIPGQGGAWSAIGSLGGTDSVAYNINDSGKVVGYSKNTAQKAHAFIYTPGGSMADLGTLGGPTSVAIGINNSAQIVGVSDLPNSTHHHAFAFTDGRMIDLGTIGGSDSSAGSINSRGQVAGASNNTANTASHAFISTPLGASSVTLFDLGTLGGITSVANALDDAGQVVGFSYMPGNASQHAFLYLGDPGNNGRMIDLDAWLDLNNPTEGAKWTLLSATGINNSGLVVGFGNYNDGITSGQRAFLLDASALTLPEPSSLTIMATIGLLLPCRRR